MEDTLMQRIHTYILDERINSPEEVCAELQLMTHAELVSTISCVLADMLAGRPTMRRVCGD
ncbi:hypothetical protein [Bradyrhizobium sp. SZCCHNRI2010]|uniref:hypothetical protein n=1 Tax=Bradyrhizobium sp. SZCCHNRI2010 TaxID=3057283 RepID=UPI0028E33A98|nr:hypothetical protein [Bradyrhizobium sp. SZCCHNRI2010]